MAAPILVVGHKNPDNDAISAAVGYAYLKNAVARRSAKGAEPAQVWEPVRLGPLPPETQWTLSEGNLPEPRLIDNVHIRVSDVMTADPVSVPADATLLDAGRLLREHGVRALVVTNADGTYAGLVTQRMIADRYIAATEAGEGQVADALVASLDQKVADLVESALVLPGEAVLSEVVEDLLGSDLREAVVLDDNGVAVGIVTRSDVAAPEKHKIVLVDHNERRQAVDGIDEAEVTEIIDHHRIGDVTTANPIKFLNLPVGSSATIVTLEARRLGIELPASIARVLLAAVLTDTVILKSPTATDVDREQVEFLANIVGVDPIEFGLAVFRTRGGVADLPIEKVVCADSKEFPLEEGVCLIGQYETVDLPSVLDRESEMRAYMQSLIKEKGYEFVLLMCTDIIAEGSQFICEGDRRIVNRVFGIECTGEGGTWMPGVLSRKKQVAAKILGA